MLWLLTHKSTKYLCPYQDKQSDMSIKGYIATIIENVTQHENAALQIVKMQNSDDTCLF